MEVSMPVWEQKGLELFGDDKTTWKFVCPSCGNEMSIEKAKEQFPEVKGKGWRPESECIGRYTSKVDCDWCAYGLFRGPLIVESEGEERACFDFAGLPFTGKDGSSISVKEKE